VLGERVEDRLAHPPHGVGDELDVALRVEALGGLHQAERALVDQVHVGHAEPAVALGVVDDEAQVGLDQPLDRLLVAALDAPAEHLLVVAGERLELRDVADVGVEAVGRDSRRAFSPRRPRRATPSASGSRDLSHSARPGKEL
jgi:hypothetical protein